MEYTVLWVTALFRVAKALLYFIMFLSFQLNHKPLPHFQKTLEHIMEKKKKKFMYPIFIHNKTQKTHNLDIWVFHFECDGSLVRIVTGPCLPLCITVHNGAFPHMQAANSIDNNAPQYHHRCSLLNWALIMSQIVMSMFFANQHILSRIYRMHLQVMPTCDQCWVYWNHITFSGM